MSVAVDTPLALLLLPIALAWTVLLHVGARRQLGIGRRRAALVVRGLLLGALVLALAGAQVVLPVDRLATVFVLDRSDSIGSAGREAELAFLREALTAMPGGDVAGIVAFGGDALVERLPDELRDVDRIASTPVQGATDIGGALRLAAALFPDDAQKRIVLLSDGNDTTGRGQAEAALAAARGIQVETRTVGLGNADEVLMERLQTPSTAHVGELVDASVTVRSTVPQPATVRLYADGALVETQRLDLVAGTTPVTFRIKATEAGFHTFRAVVEAARDTFVQNDRADSDTIVKGPPRTLVVAGNDAVGAQLVDALRAEREQVDTAIPEAMPHDFTGLANYDSVVLVDVPRTRLDDARMKALQVYVRDLGRGLVMIGGPESFGAGGYQKTPIEETLPVDMGVRSREKQPDIALVVVIDQSGSMAACHCNGADRGTAVQIQGVRKVDIGKEAILRAAAALSANDELGVVGFNEAAHWAVHTAALGQISDLQGQLGAIQPDGQTNIYAGLDQAVQSLEQASATRRHIILLTDGWSRSGAYDEIIARMKAAGITLSTVGAGGGAAPVLQQLAQEGGGRYYAAPNPGSIPDIFLKETEQVAGQQIIEEPFFPARTGDSPILRGIDALPQLLGYNGTTPKSAAQTVLVTARTDPLLSEWQYGLGRAVAWTSDASGRWAKSWLGWQGFGRFFSQLVAWTFPGEETGGIEARFEDSDGQTTLRVESVAADGTPRDFYATSATVVAPDLRTSRTDLVQTAPGIYEAPLGSLDPGAYAIRISQTRPGTTPLGRTVGLVAPTAPEYRLLGGNEALLGSLRAATGGVAVTAVAQVWTHDLSTTSRFADLWPLLLVLAMLLWPLDVALRRVSIGRRELAGARDWLVRLPERRRRVAARTKPVEGLLAARERATSAEVRSALLRSRLEAASSVPDVSHTDVSHADVSQAKAGVSQAKAGIAPTAAALPPAAGVTPTTSRSSPTPRGPIGPEAASAGPTSPPDTLIGGQADTLARLRQAKRRARGD